MLVELTPKEVGDRWSTHIREAIRLSLMPSTVSDNERLLNVLKSIVSGRLKCWEIVSDENEVFGIVTTTMSYDECDGTFSLLIYTVYAFKELTKSLVKDGMVTLIKHARKEHCSEISVYTQVESVRDLIKMYGGETNTYYVTLDV